MSYQTFQGFDGKEYIIHAIKRSARGIWHVWYFVPMVGEVTAYLTTAQKNERIR